MIYIGMDVSSKSFVVHAINERRKKLFSGEILPTRTGLRKLIKDLGGANKLVAFEAGNQMKWISLFLKKIKGVHLHVVHPNEVKWISQSDGKTDKVDARKLAELACSDMLPQKVHVVEGHVRQLRELLSARMQLQSKRIALINSLRAYMKQEGYRFPEGFFQRLDCFEKIKSLRVSDVQKGIFCSFMESIEMLQSSEWDITERILEIEDVRLGLIESVPGVGKLSSRVLLSAIDRVDRFDNSKSLSNYGALSPRIYQSGDVSHTGRINRDGRHEVRRVLLQCAHTIPRMKTYESKPLRDFFNRIERRRGKKRALVALARKILTTVYGVMKSGEFYNPQALMAYTD